MAASTRSAMHRMLERAGARRVNVRLPDTQSLAELPSQFKLETVEALALTLKAVGGRDDPFPDVAMLKAGRTDVARAILSSPKQARALLAPLALVSARKRWLQQQKKRKHESPDSVQPEDEKLMDKAASLVEEALGWVQHVKSTRDWRVMKTFVAQLAEANPEPVPQEEREGFTGEAYVCRQLSSALLPDWTILPGLELDLSHLSDVPGRKAIKGIKGELDAALCYPSGVCQGIVEVKLGGTSPYRALYNDCRKFQRMLKHVAGQGIATPDHGIVHFSPHTIPLYIVLRDGEPLDGLEVLVQAESHLLKINMSMALGSARAWQGASFASLDSQFVDLTVRPTLVSNMREKVARDFTSTIGAVDVYEMSPPPDGWAW